VIWGSTYLGMAIAIETLPPLPMAGLRFVLAGSVLMGVLRLRGIPFPDRRSWLIAGIVATFLLGGGNGPVCFAVAALPTGFVALIISVTPLWLTLMTWASGGGRPTFRVWLGIAFGMIGVAALIAPQIHGDAPLWALLAVLFASISWAFGSLISRRNQPKGSLLMTAAAQQILGGVLLSSAGLVHGDWGRVNLNAASTASIIAFAYLILIGSLVGYVAYTWLLRHTQPAVATSYAYVNPVVACFLGWLLHNESLSTTALIGAGIIILAVALVTTARPPRTALKAIP
jgi:drug/metabolite transporter (DMT)-like permease